MNRLGAASVALAAVGIAALVTAVSAMSDGPQPPEFPVLQTIEVGANPHGMRVEGDKLYLAAAGDDAIEVVDLKLGAVVARWPVGDTPLDLIRTEGGWLVTTFSGESLVRITDPDGAPGGIWPVGKGPSLFVPRKVGSLAFVVSELADRLTVFDTLRNRVVKTYATGDRPYPADVTHDGVLAFVPNRDEDSVSVIDLLNGVEVARVPVCHQPQGGSLSIDEVSYIVACGGSDEVRFINTASFEVTGVITEGLGPRPFAVAVSEDGRWAFANNAGGTSLSVIDMASRRVVTHIEAGEQPIVMRVQGERLYVASEVSNTLHVIGLPPAPSPDIGKKNEVIVLGMIHGGFKTSKRYSLDVLRQTIRAIGPDFVLAEIPPNRMDAALKGFAETGRVSEPRTRVFPEYVDVLFPLTREMDFRIIGVAAWNRHMNSYRSAARGRLRADPAMAQAWSEDKEANSKFRAALRGRGDDPHFIHSLEYDEITLRAFVPDIDYFNDALGPGGWKNINEGHYRLIAMALDRHRGAGKRFLITFGARHKYWSLDQLRKREDIILLDPLEFIPLVE